MKSAARASRARPTAASTSPDSRSDGYHQATTVDDLTDLNVQTIMQLERAARANLPASVRVANSVAYFCGTIHFIWLHVAWFSGWIAMNAWPGAAHFDPYPFTFLTLVVSLEAIFLATFILISQNEENRMSERRNALDLQINLLTEQENTKILNMLGVISSKLGIEMGDDPTLSVLEQSTRPEKLVEQIERASAQVQLDKLNDRRNDAEAAK